MPELFPRLRPANATSTGFSMLHASLRLLRARYTNSGDSGGLRHIRGGHVLAFPSRADKPLGHGSLEIVGAASWVESPLN